MAPPRRLLLITNKEAGESAIYFAVCHEIMQIAPDVEVHLAAWPGVEGTIASTNEFARRTAPLARPVVFHEIKAMPMTDAFLQQTPDPSLGDYVHPTFRLPPGMWNTPKSLASMAIISMPYTTSELVKAVISIVDIIEEVQPDHIAVNSLCSPAMTAAFNSGKPWSILSPNTIKEFAASGQPYGAGVWKYPCLCSAHPYPVPLHLIPLNIYYNIATLRAYVYDGRVNKVKREFANQTGMKVIDVGDIVLNTPRGVKILVNMSEACDFPLMTIPKHIVPCGLIVRKAAPVSESDPALAEWLRKGPTVYINLGTHNTATEDDAVEMALAIRVLIDSAKNRQGFTSLQFLWKLKKDGNYDTASPFSRPCQALSKEIKEDRVRIVDWIKAEPIAVLETGDVICSVNHGGANSFAEAVWAGIPQVTLPCWADTYDFAHRVELLGIGKWGSRTMKPKWSAEELSPVLIEVMLGKDAQTMRQKAAELSALSQRHGGGRTAAAKVLLAELRDS